MVDGTSVMYSFGSSEAYSLDFSESIRFQYGLNYHLLGKRQQVIIQLICHAMDQLATKGENSKSDWINVKWVDSQKDWELKHVSNPEKGVELNTFMYTNARLYLFYESPDKWTFISHPFSIYCSLKT